MGRRSPQGPPYAQVKDYVLKQIQSGAWLEGEMIQSESQLAEQFGLEQTDAMTQTKKRATSYRQTAARRKPSGRPLSGKRKIIGVTRDGVEILQPTARPTHFTSEEIRDTIRKVLAERAKA